MILREDFYFEPRCISLSGSIRWYGEIYNDKKLENYIERTVYIRDNGNELYVYDIEKDDCNRTDIEMMIEVKATFKLICKIEKYSNLDIWEGK